MPYTVKHSGLTLITLEPHRASQTCGPYWYLVQENHYGLTAFRTRKALLIWLDERNLSLPEELAPHGTHSFQFIKGEYHRATYMDPDEFHALKAFRERPGIDNGRYTLMKLTEENGAVTENFINCNCKRPEYDHSACRDAEDNGMIPDLKQCELPPPALYPIDLLRRDHPEI